VFLKPGDFLELEIEKIGVLKNPVMRYGSAELGKIRKSWRGFPRIPKT
jgi:hypothetical protein